MTITQIYARCIEIRELAHKAVAVCEQLHAAPEGLSEITEAELRTKANAYLEAFLTDPPQWPTEITND